MSTASPLPLQPLPESGISSHDAQLLKREVAARLQQHRRRRPIATDAGFSFPHMETAQPAERPRERAGSRVADSVAARFARTVSYRDFLAQEADAAMRQADAAAEVARRNAEAVAAAQQHLLAEIEQWNQAAPLDEAAAPQASAPAPAGVLAEVLPFAAAGPADKPAPAKAEGSTAAPRPNFAHVLGEAFTAAAATTGTLAFDDPATPAAVLDPLARLAVEPKEPPTGLPTNLIEFPRQLVATRKARPRLAEGPLREEADRAPERAQLRIFEVEAESFSTVPLPAAESVLPEWTNIRLDSWQPLHETAVPGAQVSLSMPLYTAAVSSRCMAAAVDACCIGATFLVAVAVAGYAAPQLPTGLAAAAAATGSLALLGVLYLLFFFTFTEATPGMRYARIALCTFNDDNPTRSAMRRRLLAMLLAAIPIGLGFVWALLDDDRLGWHDRISRMYQREY